jgi:hypothetical protein
MMKCIAALNIPLMDVEADQKQGFRRTPHVFNDHLTTHTFYTVLSNRFYPLIKMRVFSGKEVTPLSGLARQL